MSSASLSLKEKIKNIFGILMKPISFLYAKSNKISYKENLLRNFLQNIEASDVMIQRSETQSINLNDNISIILKKISNCHQDIIPVYQENIDDVKGCVRLQDIYKKLCEVQTEAVAKGKKSLVKIGENHLKSIILNVIVVSPLMPLATLLDHMQIDNVGMAVVADEFGGSQGFITNGSIIKYLAKECNNSEIQFKADSTGKIRIDAKTDLEQFLKILENYLLTQKINQSNLQIINQIKNNLEEYRTIGGFICGFTGKIPAANTSVKIGEIMFEIVEAGPRRINTIEFHLVETPI